MQIKQIAVTIKITKILVLEITITIKLSQIPLLHSLYYPSNLPYNNYKNNSLYIPTVSNTSKNKTTNYNKKSFNYHKKTIAYK